MSTELALLMLGGLAVASKKARSDQKNGKGNGNGEGNGGYINPSPELPAKAGIYPDPCRSLAKARPIWGEGATFFKMEFDYAYSDDLKDALCAHANDTYGYVHLFNVHRGDWKRRHFNPDWEKIAAVTASIQAVGTALGGPIGAALAAVVNAVYAVMNFLNYYDEVDISFAIANSYGNLGATGITDIIQRTFPAIDELINSGTLKYKRHFGKAEPKNWDTPDAKLVGTEEIQGKTVQFKPHSRWARHG